MRRRSTTRRRRCASSPIGRASFARVLVPLALPMIVVAATQVPIADLVMKLGKALF
jgi:hypothetical protein